VSDYPTGFKITDTAAGWYKADFDDVFVRKTIFTEGGGGVLWAWGFNTDGRLGTDDIISRSTPVQTISGGTNWRSIAVQGFSAGIKTDGTLWLWGNAADGELGNNDVTNKSSPVQTISGGTNWKSISVGCCHAAAIKEDNTLWLWGRGSLGQLGNDSNLSQSSPVQTISGGTNWKQVSVAQLHSASIKRDGTLWLWGADSAGRLGNECNIYTGPDRGISSPIQTVSGGTNWKVVSSALGTTAGIKTDGTLWIWGGNTFGDVGDNTRINRSSPVQTIAEGTTWRQISLGACNALGIKTDGTLWIWGEGASGRLGNANFTSQSSPVQTISGGTNWRQAVVSSTHTAAIKTDGTLWAWGAASSGQLGTPLKVNRSSPVQTVSGGTNWRCAHAGAGTTLALKSETIF
jgi:alpha-tubulin suppressor-like RCC1 family protein